MQLYGEDSSDYDSVADDLSLLRINAPNNNLATHLNNYSNEHPQQQLLHHYDQQQQQQQQFHQHSQQQHNGNNNTHNANNNKSSLLQHMFCLN